MINELIEKIIEKRFDAAIDDKEFKLEVEFLCNEVQKEIVKRFSNRWELSKFDILNCMGEKLE